MAGEGAQTLAAGDLPQLDRGVRAAGQRVTAVKAQTDRRDGAAVAGEGAQAPAGRHLPQVNQAGLHEAAVVALDDRLTTACQCELAIGAKAQGSDRLRLVIEGRQTAAGRRLP